MIAVTGLARFLVLPILPGVLLCPVPAAAQVFQIEPDGAVLVRQGSGAVQWQRTGTPDGTTLAPTAPPALPAPIVSAATCTSSTIACSTLLHQAAAQAGLHPAVLEALVWQESRWRPGAVSRKGAIGLTQLMPGTARALGVNPYDPVANLIGGARYLRSLLDHFDGDLIKALAAYNAGARRVEKAGGVPRIRETQDYVVSILNRLNQTFPSR
ncbi:lytic transglycosylase domain-containing protein [Novosphingobium sp.]|uniref:lytic transglycosylase domain-containing protein n=1 Tax=Novosphingobium sp. TaxID=1874826 RepID=UPI00261305C4|nr:lytic transglycosylase domain-containing protein [Novosphingobium sp.]